MKTHIEHQILEKNGRPEYAVLPYAVFLKLSRLAAQNDQNELERIAIPMKVIEIEITEGKSLARAWREYLKLSQAEVAAKMGVSQAALSQLEKSDAKLRKATIKKLADALSIQPEQLQG